MLADLRWLLGASLSNWVSTLMNHCKLLTSFVPGMEAAVIALLLGLANQIQRQADRWLYPVALSTVASSRRYASRGSQFDWHATTGGGTQRPQPLREWAHLVLAAPPPLARWGIPSFIAAWAYSTPDCL